MTAHEHNRVVGTLLIVHGAISAFLMIAVGAVYAVLGAALFAGGRNEADPFLGAFFIVMIAFMGIFSTLMIIPQIVGGFKLLKQRPNARNWGIVGSIVALLSFPLGTAAGVYGLWFLFGDGGKEVYLAGSNQKMFQHPPQPPEPSDWR